MIDTRGQPISDATLGSNKVNTGVSSNQRAAGGRGRIQLSALCLFLSIFPARQAEEKQKQRWTVQQKSRLRFVQPFCRNSQLCHSVVEILHVLPVVIICVEPTDSLSHLHYFTVKRTNAVIFPNAQGKCVIVVVRCVIKAVCHFASQGLPVISRKQPQYTSCL